MKHATFRQMGMVVLAAALLGTVAPAQAQAFHFGFGSGDVFEQRPARLCLLTERQLRQAIAQRGYSEIFLNVANNHRIQVRASRGDWVYLLAVDSCTGRILDRERLRRR